ncbi:putative F-box protein At1g32140 [Arabidopsis lyrata subsp. lyrata]|uniref:putative F-box protein At1g32140 n=1 Tax=Arabidopsis lyrata subsp. lyrata TaxID=81972 RepID=UPI000A29C2CF|nr:putative F-box protein At1g32140 [Arabidopsis lyrata subsp. lyrata]|eukprot:XP_020866107.1 putative F-box protein At1g32140 [Arabidopsis lyrata subsp. lyrata]
MNNKRKLVVWNPYLGQTRWIQPKNDYREGAKYALGYDNNKNHKILRFFDRKGYYEIYDLKSNSWSLSNVIPNWQIYCCERYTSLKGNTYFISAKKNGGAGYDFILCFDFTTERFGQILPLPFKHYIWTLSCVKEEKLAVAVLCWENTYVIEIWMTIKIDPNAASWSKFLRVDRKPPIGLGFVFANRDDSFFIDEEKKVAVVFSSDEVETSTAYIIRDNKYLKTVDLEKAANFQESLYCFLPLVCSCSSYYVPSLVQINQIAGHKSKDKKRKRTNKV